MKIYAIVGWCGNERYIEGYYTNQNTALKECACMNKNRMIGLESLIVETADVDEIATKQNIGLGYVYEISRKNSGAWQARLEAVMWKDDFQKLKKAGKAKSPLMCNPYVWVEKKSEKKAIEAYINKQ